MVLAREIQPPELSPEDIATIAQTVFSRAEPRPADVLFIFGTSHGDWQLLADACLEMDFPHVVVNGKTGKWYEKTGQPLAHRIRDELLIRGVDSRRILVQDRSTNTFEDAELGLALVATVGGGAATVTFASKEHHSGRCARTLARLGAEPVGAVTYPAVYDGVTVRRIDWFETPTGRARVYGEYLRILKYSARGDIAEGES